MCFNLSSLINRLRYLLFPFSIIYGIITYLRNWLFDIGFFKAYESDVPVIAVGNLNTGGSGKTPMIEKLIELFAGEFEIALISRGYGRKTKGFLEVQDTFSSEDCGDEPLQIKKKYPDTNVFVDEKRSRGIQQVLQSYPQTSLILLDDAFQHRKVKADFYILVSSFDKLFYADLLLPMGNLRESRFGAKRADLVVITKIPTSLNSQEKEVMRQKVSKYFKGEVYFSGLTYGEFVSPVNSNARLDKSSSILLVTGIAKPQVLNTYMKTLIGEVDHVSFPDHHVFSSNDIERLLKQYKAITNENKALVTTEKDWTRLQSFSSELQEVNVILIPVKISLDGGDQQFSKTIYNRITGQ